MRQTSQQHVTLAAVQAQKADTERSQRGSFDDSVRPLHRLG